METKNSTATNGFKLMSNVDHERMELIEVKYPFIKDAYNILGVEKVRRFNYIQTNIKRDLINNSDKSNHNKIFRFLSEAGLKSNIWISRADCKSIIQNAFNEIKIDKIAKATNIYDYFEVNPVSKRIEKDGSIKVVKGFQIIREKLLFS